jgi:SpoVK/Ycf46/Vps4 family AAA+-type ATPase
MGRQIEPRAAQRPRAASLERLRSTYHRTPLRTRLLAGLGIVLAAAVVAVLTQLSVWATVTGTVLLLALFTAFMHSAGALATAVVCVGWTVVAHTLMSIPLHGQPALLLIPLLPLPVALVAARISAFPVWHTTLVTLLGGLIVGFGLALAHMPIPAVPASLGVAGMVLGAAVTLLWRWVAARQLTKELDRYRQEGRAAAAAGPAVPAAQRARARGGKGSAGKGEVAAEEPIPVTEALAQLESMIGLEPVKQQVRAIAAAIEAARLRADAGYSVDRPLRHFVFSGPPGTGKTSVARTLATIFHSFGLLPTARVVEASRADLVGEYLGATAIKTNELVDRALGGVLFIDEAYSLVNEGDGQPDRFGNEAVQTLLKRAEDDRDRLVIILAGYEAEMDRFLASNPGLASRFATRISFPSYTADELRRIAESFFARRGDRLDEAAAAELAERMEQVVQRGVVDELGNGRFARSLVEKAAEARDVRVVTRESSGKRPDPEELVTVRAADIVAAYEALTARLPGFTPPPDITEALAELDAMVGLEPVKRQVRAIAAQLRMARLREGQGLRVPAPMRHFVFVGPPGTGKTTVARILGRVFAALGLLTRADVVEASRADLVGEHLGATAIKTNQLVDRALGGVLFIDEAYSLVNPGYSGGDAFGSEAVQTLLKRAEDDRDRLVIVLAGYPEDMDRFLHSNAGLASRFTVRVAFPSYTPQELIEIAERTAAQTGDSFDEGARADMERVFSYVCESGWIDELGNGRFARSLFEKACSYRDLRVAENLGERASAADLTTITSADLRAAYTELTQR